MSFIVRIIIIAVNDPDCIVKFLAVLAVLGAVVYAVVAYWDKIMELVCKVKGLISGKCDDCMEDVEFADWEE